MRITSKHTHRKLIVRTIALAAGLLLLASCGTAPIERPAEPADGQTATSRGQHEQAARAFEAEALLATPDRAAALWISAADAWIMAGAPVEARAALRRADKTALSSADQARLDLVLADLALASGRTDEAEALLQRAAAFIPPSSRSRYEDLYARLAQQMAGPVSRDIGRAARLSESMRYYDPAAALEIMQVLEPVSSGELAVRAHNPRGERNLTEQTVLN